MRNHVLKSALVPLVLLSGGAAWGAEVGTKADRELRLATTRLEEGQRKLLHADRLRTNAAKVNEFDKAIYQLRQARSLASRCRDERCAVLQEVVDDRLVAALTSQAAIYFERGSYSLALKRAEAALALEPDDPRARNLVAAARTASSRDPLDGSSTNSAFVQRVRDRRAGLGLTLRERGVGARRF